MKKQRPALLGGEPVRSTPYPKHTTNLNDEEKQEILDVIDDGELSGFSGRSGDRFLGGAKVKLLEADFAKYFKVKHAVSFNSATSALHGAIAAAGIGPGDEVITSPYTMSSSATAVLMNNAIPIFADIDPDTFNISPSSIEEKITDKTRAIMAVNIFGQPAELDKIKQIAIRHGLILIEDSAQSPGAFFNGELAGTIGEMGVFSLNYHKMIQCGEGGILITNDDTLALKAQLVRNHGELVVPDIEGLEDMDNQLGWNYRLTELQAAVAIPQLRKLKGFTDRRNDLAEYLTDQLKAFDFLATPLIHPEATHVYYVYAIKYDEEKLGIPRSIFAQALRAEGMVVGEGYMKPLYLNPVFQKKMAYTKGCPYSCAHYNSDIQYKKGLCPVTEDLYEKTLLTTEIIKYPNTETEVDEFISAVVKIADNAAELKAFSS